MAKLKGGIVGCGGIGTSKHLPSIKKVGLAEVGAFCDIIEERAIEMLKEIAAYKILCKENKLEIDKED